LLLNNNLIFGKINIMAIWNTIELSDVRPDRCDAEYFRKDYQDNLNLLESTGKVVTLGKLFKYINRGTQPIYNKKGTIKALRSVNVGFMNFNETRQEYVTEDFFTINTRGKVQKDDILITSTGVGTLGRTSIWFKDEKAFCDGHITILRNGKIDPYFITVFLNSKYGLKQYDQNYRGSSGQIEIYPYDISKFVIPECLFQYQIEIGNYLREAFELQTQSQTLYKQATDLLEQELGLDKISFEKAKSYTASFSEVVSTIRLDSNHYQPKYKLLEDHLKENFTVKKIGYLVNYNRRGLQPSYDSKGTVDVVNSKHITSTHLKYDSFEKTELSNFKFCIAAQIHEGDILIYTTGAYVGQTNVYLSDKPALASNHVNILRLKDPEIDSTYVALVLNNIIGKMQTEQHIRGSAQAELYPNDIAKFWIPILDIDKMKAIGDLVRASLKLIQKSQQLLVTAKDRVEQLIEAAADK
jgi:restriction endonuclease S subunit